LFKHIRTSLKLGRHQTSQLSKVWRFFTISTADKPKTIKEFLALQIQ